MSALEQIKQLADERPLLVAGVAGGAVLIGAFLFMRRGAVEDETAYPGPYLIENDPTAFPPDTSAPPPVTDAPAGLIDIFRKGQGQKVTAGPESLGCAPGYVAAQQPGQPPRCTLRDDRLKKKGQRTSYVPSLGQGPFTTNVGGDAMPSRPVIRQSIYGGRAY